MQALLHEFAGARVADLKVSLDYAAQLWHQRWLVEPDNTQLTALLSTLGLAVAINVLLMLLVPRGRKLVLDTVETLLAIALLAVLIAAVLGLPLVIIYLVLKALAFLLNVLLSIPAISGLLSSAMSALGQR